MNKTAIQLLKEIIQTGQAVIVDSRKREHQEAQAMISEGLAHVSSTHHGFYIIKLGRNQG